MTATAAARPTYPTAGPLRRSMRRFTGRAGIFLVAVAILSAFLMPLAYMALTALKDQAQVADPGAPLYPASPRVFEYEGTALPIYAVPIDGVMRQLAIVEKGRESSVMVDEAAMIDGAGPLRILRSVVVPQAIPAIVAVTLFHFFFAWNEFLLSLVYVGGNPDLWPLSLGMQKFASLYVTRPPLVQASAILAIAVPVVVFFLSQRAFMRGVVVTGVDK